jgi:hypothetical protein
MCADKCSRLRDICNRKTALGGAACTDGSACRFPPRAVFALKRAVFVLKRAVFVLKRAVFVLKRAVFV